MPDDKFVQKPAVYYPETEDMSLVGSIGECSKGRPGLILDHKHLPWGPSWVGIGLDGKGSWASRNPKVLFKGLDEYIDSKIQAALEKQNG